MKRYIAIGPFCWGVGKTPAIAKRNCAKHRPSFLTDSRMTVYEVGPTAEVTGDGGLQWNKDDMKPRKLEST